MAMVEDPVFDPSGSPVPSLATHELQLPVAGASHTALATDHSHRSARVLATPPPAWLCGPRERRRLRGARARRAPPPFSRAPNHEQRASTALRSAYRARWSG